MESILLENDEKRRFMTISVWDRLYKTELIKDIKFPKGKCYEDIMYTTQSFARAKKIAYVNLSLYHYRIRKGSITNTKMEYYEKTLTDNLALREEQIKFFAEREMWNNVRLVKCIILRELFSIRHIISPKFEELFNRYSARYNLTVDEIILTRFSKKNKLKLILKHFMVKKI